MSAQIAKTAAQATAIGRPIVSQTSDQAKKRVLASYKKWQRQLPRLRDEQHFYDYPMEQFRLMIKDQFVRNKNVTDIRIIDRLVAKSDTELFNTYKGYNNPDHLRNYLVRDNIERKPKDFLSRFFSGKD